MLQSRMQREIHMLATDPPPGVYAAPKDGHKLTELEAQLEGPAGSVYEGGVFKLSVDIPPRYPIEPPKVRFITPIYHPNIDPEGRICLDILNPPPKGAWKPSLNISTVLTSIGLLLADPNPDDGLVAEISKEFKHQRSVFDTKARQWTKRHAITSDANQVVENDEEVAHDNVVDQQQQQKQQQQQDDDSRQHQLPLQSMANTTSQQQKDTVVENNRAATGTVTINKRALSPTKLGAEEQQQAKEQQQEEVPVKKSKLGLHSAK